MIFLPVLLWFSGKGQVGIKANRLFLARDQGDIYLWNLCATKVSHLVDAKFLPPVESIKILMANIKFLNPAAI